MARILRIDGETAGDCVSLKAGITLLGRGPLLKCAETKVSRNHAALRVDEDGNATLEALHVNPCYFWRKEEEEHIVLAKGSSVNLNTGDHFSLLPNLFRFYYEKEEVPESNDEEAESNDEEAESNDEEAESNDKEAESSEKEEKVVKRKLPSWLLNSSPVEMEILVDTRPMLEFCTPTGSPLPFDAELLPSTSKKDSSPKTNGQNVLKLPCRYGANCYRKNPDHLKQFSHPNDDSPQRESSQPLPTTNDAGRDSPLPRCPHGERCYRKNPDHRRQFDHSADSPRKKRRAAQPGDPSGKKDEWEDLEEDLGDLEDLEDSGSDFVPSESTSDSPEDDPDFPSPSL